MRNAVRVVNAMIAAAAALILVAPATQANVLDEIVIAHRGGATDTFGEGTLMSYQSSVANNADILDGDIHWTKDSPTIPTSSAQFSSSMTPRLTGSPTARARCPPGTGPRSARSAVLTSAVSRSFTSRISSRMQTRPVRKLPSG
jgi:hypothetical protein